MQEFSSDVKNFHEINIVLPIDTSELLMEDPDAPEEESFDALYRVFQHMWANTLFDVDRRAYMIRDFDHRVRRIIASME